MINRLLKNLFPLLLVSIYLNSTAQKNTADSIALVACIDSINAHISKDATCSYCNSILDKCSTPDAVKNYPELVSSAFRRVEDCYHNKYDLAHTVPVIERLGKLARDNNSDDLQAWYLNMTGQMMFNANQSDSVLPVLLHSLKLFEKIKTSRDGLSLTCEFLGGVYWKINDTTKCIYYHKKSLEYAEGSKWLKHIMLTNISVYYTRVKQYDSARTYTLRAIEEEDKYKRGHGVSYITLLRIDYNSGADEKTLESDFQNGMPQSQKVSDYNGIRYAYLTYSNILIAKKNYVRAKKLLADVGKYIDACKEYIDERAEYYRLYFLLYDSLHNAPLALQYLKKFDEASKESDVTNAQKNIEAAQANYEFEKKQTEMRAEQQQQMALANEKLKGQQLQKIIFIGASVLLAFISLLILRNLRNQKRAAHKISLQKNVIEQEHKKSEALLLNILPYEVAQELKQKGTADAKLFENVTVFFSDFKGFTGISEKLSPQDLVNELHECFSAFDNIMHKYNIEKIKTVGDAYLAVSGLPTANLNHAEDMVKAALEIQQFISNRIKERESKAPFGGLGAVRIGIHSGHVVAGIVGIKKFAYDIWGDTVNTAARMEQNGEAGKVNISEATYELVKDKFRTEYRGEVDAKNKGLLKMYFVF